MTDTDNAASDLRDQIADVIVRWGAGPFVVTTNGKVAIDVQRAADAIVREVLAADVREEWAVFYGGPDPENAEGLDTRDDHENAREWLQWMDSSHGRGVAVRSVFHGPWRVVDFDPPAAESRGDGEPRG